MSILLYDFNHSLSTLVANKFDKNSLIKSKSFSSTAGAPC